MLEVNMFSRVKNFTKSQVFNIQTREYFSEVMKVSALLPMEHTFSGLCGMCLDFDQSKQEIIHRTSGKDNTWTKSKSNL